MRSPINLHVRDVTHGNQILPRAMVIQQKTQRPVQFELTEPTRAAVAASFDTPICANGASLGRSGRAGFIGPHSMRRTKATLIYKRTKNLRAVQLLLGHTKLESTVRYLGIEVDDALEISEQTEI